MKKTQNILNKFTSSIMIVILFGINFVPVLSYATNQATQETNELEKSIIFDVTINGEQPYTDISDDVTTNSGTSNDVVTENNVTSNGAVAENNVMSNGVVAENNAISNDVAEEDNLISNNKVTTDNDIPNDATTNNETTNDKSTAGNETSNTETQSNNDVSNSVHSYVASLEEKLKLKFSLSVNGDGYIKDGIISINDNNYKIGEINNDLDEQTIENIRQTNSSSIEIGQVNSKNPINFELPIEFEKQDLMSEEYFNKESKVKLEANYINSVGLEEHISKEVTLNLQWDEEAEGYVNQELKRYLKYDNKTLVSFLVTAGIKDNKLPQLGKTTQILVPKIADQEPSKIIVTGDVSDYVYENQVLVIKDSNGFAWDSSSEYLVTYIYDSQMNEGTLSTAMIMNVNSVNNKTIELRTDAMSYEVKDDIGSLLDTKVESVEELSKGYLYANLNRTEKLDTTFGQIYQMNIGLVDFIDEIEIFENQSNIITKKVMVDANELTQILGENGTIKVLDKDYVELGTINKDNLELNVNNNSLRFIASKPVQEGNINLYLSKIIDPSMSYTKESLRNLNELETSVDIMGTYQGNVISNNHIVKKINLVEPSSNASISITQSELATVGVNEDVVITATLETNNISDALYMNPELIITLPSQITNINLKEAKLLYDDELVPADLKTQGTQIYFRLDGTQTKYSSIPTASGSVIQVIADLTLDNLAVSSEEKIVLDYSNPARNEIKSVDTPVKIVAPTGFVTANYAMQTQTVTAIENDETFEIPANDVAKRIILKGTIVSNSDEPTTGMSILGRVPGQGTTSADGVNSDLGSTYTTNMRTPIVLENMDADIYYSENGQANYDLGNAGNGWTQQFTTNAKSYLIVARSDIAPTQRIDFTYEIAVPSHIDYEQSAFSIFAVYYDNNDPQRNY